MILRHPNKAIEQILDSLTEDEMHSAMWQYAKKDKDFLFHLLCHYIQKIEAENEEEKYNFLFYKVIQHYVPGNKRVLLKKARQVVKLSGALLRQAKDLFAIESYRSCFYILKPGITFLKLLTKRTKGHKDVISIYLDYHTLLGQLINTTLPPPLRDEIKQYCVSQSCTYDYIPPVSDFNLFNFSFRLLPDESSLKSYYQDLMELFDDPKFETENQQVVVNLMFRQALKRKLWTFVEDLLQKGLIRPEESIRLAAAEAKCPIKDQISIALMAFNQARGRVRYKIICNALRLAIQDGKQGVFKDALKTYFKHYSDLKFFIEMKQNGLINQTMLKAIKPHIPPQKELKPKQSIQVFHLFDNHKKLIKSLSELKTVEEIVKYVALIPDALTKDFESLVFTRMTNIAETYFGPNVSDQFTNILSTLAKEGYADMSQKLGNRIQEKYPNRQRLIKDDF